MPITIDTATNRRDMPGADVSTWTPIAAIGAQLAKWAAGEAAPANGAFVEIKTTDGETAFNVVDGM
jgi:dihydropteridine reductase